MIPFRRASRQSEPWSSSHDRARTLAARQMDEELGPDESGWLGGHLEACAGCRTAAERYREGRDLLRGLRDSAPPPPRDLWARTAAAIESESRSRRRYGLGRRRSTGVPLGAVSGALVMAVVLGATMLSNLPPNPKAPPALDATSQPQTAQETPLETSAPASLATPILVGDSEVTFVRLGATGNYDFSVARFDRVCPAGGQSGCAPLEESVATTIAVETTPKSVISSPGDDHAVVVAAPNGTKATDVYVVSLPEEDDPGTATPAPDPTATPASSSTPPPTDTPDLPTSEPTTSPATVPSAEPTVEPSTSPEPEPDPTATDDPQATPDPGPTPETIAIAQDLIVVGQAAAYSPDGSSFAFTARPSDGSYGSDIYVWTVGEDKARPVTWDHRSVFGSWNGQTILGSRPLASPEEGTEVEARSFVLDPETGEETHLEAAGWLPVLDPSGRWAVTWVGTVTLDADGEIVPATGGYELRPWNGDAPGDQIQGAPIAAGSAHADIRWDETGTAFAVWLEDAVDPAFGRLSLHFVDAETGEHRQPSEAPRDVPALPGYAIEDGRLAWGTPPGQGGEGSRVLVVAWNGTDVGTVESAPGDEVVLVR